MVPVARHLSVSREAEHPYMLKVAFATNDGETVNQHFGYARSILIFGIDMERADLLTVAEFCDEKEAGEDKLAARIEYLSGCAAVYSYACGATAVRRLMTTGIQPIRVIEEAPIKELIKALQEEIRQGPGSWLAKALAREQYPQGSVFDQQD